MESGPGPPVDAAPDPQASRLPQTRQTQHAPVPQLPPLPLFPSLPPFSAVPRLPQLPRLSTVLHLPQLPQAVEASEVIDLTGLSDGDDGDDWEDVPEVIDLTNLPSSDEDDDENDADTDAQLDHVPQNYTILNLPPRDYPLLNGPPIPPNPPQTRSEKRAAKRAAKRAERAAARAARAAGRVPARVPARVPVRRDICELCARIVRWGPGCLITKHHLYPQEITKKHPDRYTQAQKGSLALLCRPCHDACHRAHSNKTLADFYYEIDLLKADPNIQAHISSMQRATTPELIARHGDGVNVRLRKEKVRLARSNPQSKVVLRQGKALSRYNLRQKVLLGPPAAQPPPAAAAQPPPPPPPPGVRRSARLLAKNIGEQPQVPVIVIDDEDEDMQDGAIHEDPREEENDGVQDIVTEAELAVLEGLEEYIRL